MESLDNCSLLWASQDSVLAQQNLSLRAVAAGGHLSIVNYLLEIDGVLECAAADGNAALREAAAGVLLLETDSI